MSIKNELKTIETKGQWATSIAVLVAWVFVLVVVAISFFNILPTILIMFGATFGLIGATDEGLSLMDAMIFLLTGASFTAVLTWIFMGVVKRIKYNIVMLHQATSEATKGYFERRKLKKETTKKSKV